MSLVSQNMIPRLLLCLFIIMSVTIGCKRNDSLALRGSINDGKTGGILCDAEVIVSSNSISNGFYSNNFEEVARSFSNETGMFEIEFEPGNAVEFEIIAIKLGMIQFRDTVNRDVWIRGEDNKFDISMYRSSHIYFEFRNGGTSSTLLFKLDPKSDGCYSCCPNNTIAINPGLDTNFSCQVYGNQSVSYELNIIDGSSSNLETGIIQVYEDSVSFVHK
jgi:hypothetical protein